MNRTRRAGLSGIAVAAALAGCGGEEAPAPPEPLDPAVTDSVEVGGAPVAVAVGEGGVWVADNAGSQVLRLDPADGSAVGKPIPVRGGPLSIAVGEGAVWVAGGDGTISRIDPAGAEVAEVGDPIPQPGGIAVGEGSVWVTSSAENTLTRLDASSGDPAEEYEVGEFPTDVAVAEGSVWVANTNDGTVSRIDVATGEASDPVEVAAQQVLAVTVGEDGVWVAGSDDEPVETIDVSRIDPSSGELDGSAAAIETGIPVRLVAGEGGVWATVVGPLAPLGAQKKGSVTLLDPASGEESGEPVRVGSGPSGIATGEGSVWVANAGDATVSRIDPDG